MNCTGFGEKYDTGLGFAESITRGAFGGVPEREVGRRIFECGRGFFVEEEQWIEGDGKPHRIILRARFADVSESRSWAS